MDVQSHVIGLNKNDIKNIIRSDKEARDKEASTLSSYTYINCSTKEEHTREQRAFGICSLEGSGPPPHIKGFTV